MRKRIGLKDIAEKLDVSISLVSYVLNNKHKNRINKETAKRIREVASELGYQTNQIAKSLKKSKTQTIGLIVADISNPFSGSIARIIEDEAKKSDYTLLFGSADEDSEKAGNLINILLNRQVDGFIIAAPYGSEDYLLSLKKQEVPFILIDRYYPLMDFNYIIINNFEASYQAVKHLINNGYKNIGLLNYETNLFHMNDRTRGYIEAIKDSGMLLDETNIIKIDEKRMKEDMGIYMNKLMTKKNPIDAIFFSTNNIAIEGLKYLSKQGVTTTDEIGIVCFDETSAYELFHTTLTHIKQPLKMMGKHAVKLLLKLMKNNNAPPIAMKLETELVIRKSSERAK